MKNLEITLNKKTYQELINSHLTWCYIGIIAGLLLGGLYVLLSILFKNWFDIHLVIAVVGFVILIVALFLIFTSVTNLNKVSAYVSQVKYQFDEEGFSYEIYRDNRKVEAGKVTYQEITGYKETKSFIFLCLNNGTFFAFNKNEELLKFVNDRNLPKYKGISANKKR